MSDLGLLHKAARMLVIKLRDSLDRLERTEQVPFRSFMKRIMQYIGADWEVSGCVAQNYFYHLCMQTGNEAEAATISRDIHQKLQELHVIYN